MKLRIRGDSVRLRLTRSEVETFEREGYVEDRTQFAPGSPALVYRLESDPRAEAIVADYSEHCVRVRVPERVASEWVDTDLVGFSAEQTIDAERSLSLLVEKDFRCLVPRGDEDDDGFPNPDVEGASC